MENLYRIDLRLASGKTVQQNLRAQDEHDALEVFALLISHFPLEPGWVTDVIVQRLRADNENGCPQAGNLGLHSERYLDGGRCIWCGAEAGDDSDEGMD